MCLRFCHRDMADDCCVGLKKPSANASSDKVFDKIPITSSASSHSPPTSIAPNIDRSFHRKFEKY